MIYRFTRTAPLGKFIKWKSKRARRFRVGLFFFYWPLNVALAIVTLLACGPLGPCSTLNSTF